MTSKTTNKQNWDKACQRMAQEATELDELREVIELISDYCGDLSEEWMGPRFDVLAVGGGVAWRLFHGGSAILASKSVFFWAYELPEPVGNLQIIVVPTGFELPGLDLRIVNPFRELSDELSLASIQALHRSQDAV